MSFHVRPGPVGSWHTIPVAEVLEKNWLFCKDDVCKVDKLHGGERLISMISKLAVFFNGIEDDVHWV